MTQKRSIVRAALRGTGMRVVSPIQLERGGEISPLETELDARAAYSEFKRVTIRFDAAALELDRIDGFIFNHLFT